MYYKVIVKMLLGQHTWIVKADSPKEAKAKIAKTLKGDEKITHCFKVRN